MPAKFNNWNIPKLKRALLTYSRQGMVDVYYGKRDRTEPEMQRLHDKVVKGCLLMDIPMVRLDQKMAKYITEERMITEKLGPDPRNNRRDAEKAIRDAEREATGVEFSCPSIC